MKIQLVETPKTPFLRKWSAIQNTTKNKSLEPRNAAHEAKNLSSVRYNFVFTVMEGRKGMNSKAAHREVALVPEESQQYLALCKIMLMCQ